MTQTSHSDEEIQAKIDDFHEQLAYCNAIYMTIVGMGVTADFYSGPNLSQVHLPDKAIFTQTIRKRFR